MEAEIIEEVELQSFIPEGVEICVTTTEFQIEEPSNEEIVQSEELEILEEPVMMIEEEIEGDIECDECGLVLSKASTMKLHKEQIHPEEAFYACEFCSATRIHWSEYYVHQCTNLENKPLVCPQCQQTVSTKKQLQVHEEIHALQRRFTTKKLDSYFARKLEEAEDPTVDWGLKPFLCGICGKPFGKLYEVEYHEKLHSEERLPPHCCSKCNMRYINKNDLNKHIARGCSSEMSRKTAPPPAQK